MTFGADDKGVWQHYSHNSQFSGIWNKHGGGGAHRGLHQAVEASQYVTGSQQRGPEKPLHETEKTEPGYWSCQHHGTSTKESCRHHGFTWERGHSGSRQHGWRIWLLICSHMLPDKLQVPDMELWGLGGVPPPRRVLSDFFFALLQLFHYGIWLFTLCYGILDFYFKGLTFKIPPSILGLLKCWNSGNFVVRLDFALWDGPE